MVHPLIMFHHFHNVAHPRGQGSIDSEKFYDFIKKIKSNLISPEEWILKANKGILRSDETCLSFDDNLLCQYDIALPVLEALNIKAFWFINSGPFCGVYKNLEIYRYFRSSYFKKFDEFYDNFIKASLKSDYAQKIECGLEAFVTSNYLLEFSFYSHNDRVFRFLRDCVLTTNEYNDLMDNLIKNYGIKSKYESLNLWMSKENIKELSDNGHHIGLHSHSHFTSITKLTYMQQNEDYFINYKILTDIIKKPVITIAYPSNSYNTDTFKILQELNIEFGFKSNNSDKIPNSRFEYPRIDHTLFSTDNNINKILLKR